MSNDTVNNIEGNFGIEHGSSMAVAAADDAVFGIGGTGTFINDLQKWGPKKKGVSWVEDAQIIPLVCRTQCTTVQLEASDICMRSWAVHSITELWNDRHDWLTRQIVITWMHYNFETDMIEAMLSVVPKYCNSPIRVTVSVVVGSLRQ